MTASLCIHTPGSHRVNYDDLSDFPNPEAIGARHKPVPHIEELVDTVQAAVGARGFNVTRQEYGVARMGKRLFGVMDLDVRPGDLKQDASLAPFKSNGASVSIGLRNSHDQGLAIGLVGGKRLFVCDNLIFDGEVLALSRKNTTGLDNLRQLVDTAMGDVLKQVLGIDSSFDMLAEYGLSNNEARLDIYRTFESGVIPGSWFSKVHTAYFSPEGEDTRPRNRLGLFHAFTRVARDVPNTVRLFDVTTALGSWFGIGDPSPAERAYTDGKSIWAAAS